MIDKPHVIQSYPNQYGLTENEDVIERKKVRSGKAALKAFQQIKDSPLLTDLDKILYIRALTIETLNFIEMSGMTIEDSKAMLFMLEATREALKMIGYYEIEEEEVTENVQ